MSTQITLRDLPPGTFLNFFNPFTEKFTSDLYYVINLQYLVKLNPSRDAPVRIFITDTLLDSRVRRLKLSVVEEE